MLFKSLSLILSVLIFTGCSRSTPPPVLPPTPVKTIIIEKRDIPAVFEYVGVIESSHEVEIRARVTGYLEEIGYIEGAFVKKGDLLFQIDPKPFEVALAKANAQLEREKAVLWEASRSVKRFKPLYEQKAASQRDLDNATASEMAAEAQVLEAQALVSEAEINLGYTTIQSPVNGQTTQAKYRVGALISPTQEELTTVSVIDPIWVVFSISEQDVLRSDDELKKGRILFPPHGEFEVALTLADQSLYPERGIVNFASPSYSEKTGTLTVRAVLANAQNILRPGQFVRVKVHGAVRPQAIAIPQEAVQQGLKGPFVFVVKEGKAEVRRIVPGPWSGDEWIIWEGLEPGDKVIVEGVNRVAPGALVHDL